MRIFAALPSNPAAESRGYPTDVIEFRILGGWNHRKLRVQPIGKIYEKSHAEPAWAGCVFDSG